MSAKLDQLKAKLRELFQLDRPDLDFGFYRVMHAKQHEIDTFLDRDLLPQVQAALASLKPDGSAELDEAVKQAKALGMDPDTVPRVRELREKYGAAADPAKTEDEIYSHLLRFFSRYYDNGDFISMRRYKAGVYAIPYEGEEVVLHWANKDQYYIKSSENLRDYTVKLTAAADAPRLHFKLVEADVEKDNVKAADDKKRVFIFNPDKTEILPDSVSFGFEYRPDPEGRKQESQIAACVDHVKSRLADFGEFATLLLALAPTEKRRDRTVLEKHLCDYTSKNTMDYFIHKDLGGFLRRELDFYIKNEVMHLDDIEHDAAPRVEQYLAQVRVIRAVARKIIDFLAQLEDFQKRLWLKKKFVVQTDWCITLDRVPAELFTQISQNDAQLREWVKLGFIEEAQIPALKQWLVKCAAEGKNFEQKAAPKDLFGKADSAFSPQPSAFSLFMVIDTALYDAAFKQKLLAAIEDIDAQTDGLLIHSENFQALNLLQERYTENVNCIYIDPPYNTDASPIIYKNGYKSSTWASMLNQTLCLTDRFLTSKGALCATIDDFQQRELSYLLETAFGQDRCAGTICIRSNPSGRPVPTGLAQAHEYAIFTLADAETPLRKLPRSEKQSKRYKENDGDGKQYMWELFRKRGSGSRREDRPTQYYPLFVSGESVRVPKMEWDEKARTWNLFEQPAKEETLVYPIDEDGMARRWRGEPNAIRKNPSNYRAKRNDDGVVTIYYKFSPQSSGVTPPTVWTDAKYSATEHGTGIVKSMFDDYDPFSYPKSVYAVSDCLLVLGADDFDALILDYFGGSGTTAHAAINLNREDSGNRKYILVEMGQHFDTVLRPRIQKVIFSRDWKDAKPTTPESGVSHCIKYVRLESYEDCLNNLDLKRAGAQDDLLKRNEALREDYTLRYMLDVESRASLLNADAFADPFSYTLKVAAGSVGETRPVTIDLVETFNYLIGLKVRTIDCIRNVTVVTGENLAGEKTLVLWRRTAETGSDALNAWFVKQGYNTQDMEFDVIYVNGDNNLENLRRDEQTWKVRLIEEEFLRRMFETDETGGAK